MELIYLLTGILLGAIAAWFTAKSKFNKENDISPSEVSELRNTINQLSLQNGRSEAENNILNNTINSLKQDIEKNRQENTRLTSELSAAASDLKNMRERFSEHKQEVEQLRERFTSEFKNIAGELLDEKSKIFTEQNKTNIDQILKPLNEKIKDFEKKVDDVYVNDSKERAGLIQQIKTLHELNTQMSRDAANLTSALKGQAKMQGNWGEFILETILEKSGLTKGNEYKLQQSFTTEDNRRLQPDVVIYLPEGKCLIIDSKVSLTAYERYCSADDEIQKNSALKEHVNSIRKHIKDLSSKSYQNLYDIKTLDFVLLFMPVEPAFSLAVQNDLNLFNEAFEKNIVIVSPSTLLATLRTIASIWRQENQNKNALEIARQGGAMYDKIQSIVEDLVDLGRKLDASKISYSDVMKKLHTGSGNLLRKAENMRMLGAKNTKTFPPAIIDKIDDDTDDELLLEESSLK